MNIIGLFPLTGNGGIASWTKKFLATFPDERFYFYPVDVSPGEKHGNGFFGRALSGFKAIRRIKRDIETIIRNHKIDILHSTTSGNLGSLRDLVVAKFCRTNNIKTILHCRYGCIPEDYKKNSLVGWLLRKTMRLYDQIWVLDMRTYLFLREIGYLNNKVYLTPNSIEVRESMDTRPKDFKRVAFVGNLHPTKGLFELTEAVLQCKDVHLDIIGPGTDSVNKHLKEIAGRHLGETISIHGRLPNNEAVKFMHSVDIIALPTYYSSEAFPISILEAMSLSKMVISCPRAAIPDMLTDLDGNLCGILVPEKSVQSIVDAICWCQANIEKANQMCQKAYDKVYHSYRTEVVYDIYRNNYKELMES